MRPRIDAQGWYSAAHRIRSPNYAARADTTNLELVVIHAISLPPRVFGGAAISQLFSNSLDRDAHPYFAALADLRVSAHFLVTRDGTVVQYVSCLDVAWHAGVSQWLGRERCNEFSLGIELEGCDELPFTPAQYTCLNQILAALQEAFPTLKSAAAHSEIAPLRKTDPGPFFDWKQIPASWRAWCVK